MKNIQDYLDAHLKIEEYKRQHDLTDEMYGMAPVGSDVYDRNGKYLGEVIGHEEMSDGTLTTEVVNKNATDGQIYMGTLVSHRVKYQN